MISPISATANSSKRQMWISNLNNSIVNYESTWWSPFLNQFNDFAVLTEKVNSEWFGLWVYFLYNLIDIIVAE